MFFTPAHTRYGTDAWNTAAHEGGTLSLETAIVYALDEPAAWLRAARVRSSAQAAGELGGGLAQRRVGRRDAAQGVEQAESWIAPL